MQRKVKINMKINIPMKWSSCRSDKNKKCKLILNLVTKTNKVHTRE